MAIAFIVVSCVLYAFYFWGNEGFLCAFLGMLPFSTGLVAMLNGAFFVGLVGTVFGGGFLYYIHFHRR